MTLELRDPGIIEVPYACFIESGKQMQMVESKT